MDAMQREIASIPELLREHFTPFQEAIEAILTPEMARQPTRILLTGCGDSHHAAVAAEMAFQVLSGIDARGLTAMHCARYVLPQLAATRCQADWVVGISASGQVARTLEAIALAGKAGARTFALTGTPGSPVAQAADHLLVARVPALGPPLERPTPGIRTYVAHLFMLYLLAIRLGEMRGHLAPGEAEEHREALLALAQVGAEILAAAAETIPALVEGWTDAQEFGFLGAGPNYGTALFCAAKVLEASGDIAWGQDTEEWAHLQYFARRPDTPVVLLTPGGRDRSRAAEVAAATRAIGRRLAVVAPESAREIHQHALAGVAFPDGLPEVFSPLVLWIPGALLAAHRSALLQEPFFRAFGGGRNVEEGGGASRIRTSVRWTELPP